MAEKSSDSRHETSEVDQVQIKELEVTEEDKEKEKSESERVEEESEREREISLFLDELMNESKQERLEKFNRSFIYDRVDVKHGLDLKDCRIRGLCVLENQRWVVCDFNNSCIKIFTLGSNMLQRYIRVVESEPWDVTEILVNQNSIEPNLVSGRSSEVSVTDRADPNNQCLIAVTLTFKSEIMFIDLSKKPAETHKTIPTEKPCYSIQFYDDKIFTACLEGHGSPWSVYIKSTDGVTLHKFDNDRSRFVLVPSLAIVSGRVYITDRYNHNVQCRNVEGQVISEITIKGSWPLRISVDPDNNVYVCAQGHNKVYKLDADLTQYKSVLDQTADYIKEPYALCYHRDKLFISHYPSSSLENYVTVVGL